MRVNARFCYSLLATVELARAFPGGKVMRAKDLAARTGVPEGFLVQILQPLRKAGVVESARGAGGGYRLTAPPADIPVGRVLRAAGGRAEYVETSGLPGQILDRGENPEAARTLSFVLSEAERSLARAFEGMTLAAVLERGPGRRPAADYQI